MQVEQDEVGVEIGIETLDLCRVRGRAKVAVASVIEQALEHQYVSRLVVDDQNPVVAGGELGHEGGSCGSSTRSRTSRKLRTSSGLVR